MNLLLAGGDRRMLMLRTLLAKRGHQVQTLGLVEGDEEYHDSTKADALLFAYPFSVKDGSVPTLTGVDIQPEKVLASAPSGIPVMVGRGLEEWQFAKRYEQCQSFLKQNAELSAEAAVFEVMLRADRALMDLRILITGYGLFGRAIALKLRALGAAVRIAARRKEVLHQAETDGMETCLLERMGERLADVDFVLNTVPAPIFRENELRKLSGGTWLMELASAPYGFDRELAGALGLNAVLLPGLPARYAPCSAAMALASAVEELLREEAE